MPLVRGTWSLRLEIDVLRWKFDGGMSIDGVVVFDSRLCEF